jgi:hypothetical protein
MRTSSEFSPRRIFPSVYSGGKFGPHSIAFRRCLLAPSDSGIQILHQPLNNGRILLDPQSCAGAHRLQQAL